jgi:hypothetical protein
MKRILLCAAVACAIGCSKSSSAPSAEKVGPAAIDPRASKPILDKARKAAEAANARNAESADSLKDYQ